METAPVVFCVVPVYNRLAITKKFLEYISRQNYQSIHLVVVDDGSTDGTAQYLAQAPRASLTVLKGNGNLWWSGAMILGMEYVMNIAAETDYLLMINDDVRIEPNYVSTLIQESRASGGAVVGSSQRDEETGRRLGSGYHLNFWMMRIMPVDCTDQNVIVDALPGRGILFPMRAVFQAGKVNAKLFPHYFADMEYTARISEMGWKVIVSKTASVFFSAEPSDKQIRDRGLYLKHFSFRSRRNLLQRLLFFSVRGPLWLRVLALPRYPFVLIWKYLTQT